LVGSSLARAAISSMSAASARVTTSACRPSITARACLPEPPWLWLTVMAWPVLPFQYPAYSALISL